MKRDEIWECNEEIVSGNTEIFEPDQLLSMEQRKGYFSLAEESAARIKDMQASDRPMEKLQLLGPKELSDNELFAILLGTGTRGMSALALANQVLIAVGNHENLMTMTIEELTAIKGIGLSKACRIIAGLELGSRLQTRESIRKVDIHSPRSIADLFIARFQYEDKEHFIALLLDTKNRIIGEVRVSTGDLNRSIVSPREVFKLAIKRSANAMILVHNHPSGDPEPSREDIQVTKRLLEGAKILGIRILDHLIIGYNQYYSMREHDIIE